MKSLRRLSIGLLALPFLIACDDGPTAPDTRRVDRRDQPQAERVWTVLEIAPASVIVEVGSTYQLSSMIVDSEGEIRGNDHRILWWSDNPAVAVMLPHGEVQGQARGYATITASFNGLEAQALVKVIGDGEQATG